MTQRPLHFADHLTEAIQARDSVLCVGLDPHRDLVPDIPTQADRETVAQRYQQFLIEIIDAVADLVPAVKPQVAFFEALGPPGYAALEAVVEHARGAGLLVISDAKRGDIGSTARAYARYHLSADGLDADAVTVNPYMGGDTLTPFGDYFDQGKGLFLLAKTSNPGSVDLQDLIASGQPVFVHTARLAQQLKGSTPGECGYRQAMLVVGATHPDQASHLRRMFPDLFFLVPGFGAQGALAQDLVPCFDNDGGGALVNSSRGVCFAFQDKPEASVADAARQAVKAANQKINAVRQTRPQ